MKYLMLLWPHANVRYQNEASKLAESELRLMLNVFAPEAVLSQDASLGMPALELELPGEIGKDLLSAMRCHSLMYGLFQKMDGGMLLPIAGREPAYVGADLPGILKYKGKTNESFLQLLVNAALYSSGFARRGGEVLELLDPMCGRGTTLFVGANRGWNTSGMDVDQTDLSEAEKFLKRYFEFHRMKHEFAKESRTLQGSKPAQMARFTFADTPGHFKNGETVSLRMTRADAARAREVYGKEKFHIIACDLPYGVQHFSVGGDPETLLKKCLPQWREALKKGGCVALSFNAKTLRTQKVYQLLEDAGFEVKCDGAYAGFEHWVEQAVTRNIAVGRRTN